MRNTQSLLAGGGFPAVFRKPLEILKVNLGYLCNLSCVHCHVNAGPKPTELMSLDTLGQVLLNLTGAAPEMHPHLQHLVTKARSRASGLSTAAT